MKISIGDKVVYKEVLHSFNLDGSDKVITGEATIENFNNRVAYLYYKDKDGWDHRFYVSRKDIIAKIQEEKA